MANLGIQTARQPDKGHHLGITAPRESDTCVLHFSKVVFILDDMNSLLQIFQWIPSGLTRKHRLHRRLRKPCVCLLLFLLLGHYQAWSGHLNTCWMNENSVWSGPCSLCLPLHFSQSFWPFTSSRNMSSLCSAQCYVAAWMGGEFGGEWIHLYVWLSSFLVHLKLSQHCYSAILQYKIKSSKEK